MPQAPSSQTYMPTHTWYRPDHRFSHATGTGSPGAGGACRCRIQFWTPNGEENSKVGTLTPADGIQVPQRPAATRGLGQRPVPPWDWSGSMWRRAEGGVRREHLQGLEAKAAPSMCSHLGAINSVSLPSPSCLRRTELLSIGPELEWRATQ